MKKTSILIFCILISSCAVNGTYESLTDLQKEKHSSIEIIEGPTDKSYSSIGEIRGTFCQRNAYESTVKKDRLIELLKISAAEADVDAVINVTCDVNQMDDLIHNCWAKAFCVGEGIKFE